MALGTGLRARISRAMAALLRRGRRLLRVASPGSKAPWSDLPPDMLALVLSRLPSRADRVRLRAVCRPWRSATRLPLPLPWFLLRDDTFLTLPDGAAHRMPLDRDEILVRLPAGGMLFLAHRDRSCSLMSPSSGETTPLHINLDLLPVQLSPRSYLTSKVVASDRIVATLARSGTVTIFPLGPLRGARRRWEPPGSYQRAHDIALFQGELYVLTKRLMHHDAELPELHLLDIGDEQARVGVRAVRRIPCRPRNGVEYNVAAAACLFDSYLVASGDRLLVVDRHVDMEVAPSTSRGMKPLWTQFEVSEAVGLTPTGSHGRWSKVNTLRGHALFVSQGCSESLPAQRGAREDCIYSISERGNPLPLWRRKPDSDLLDCVVYNMRDRTMEPLTLGTRAAKAGPWEPTWFFPADA